MHENRHAPACSPQTRLRRLWRLAVPFWLFRDAGRGTAEQQIANYRFNRSRRKLLPFYIGKWSGIAFCLMQMTWLLSDPAAAAVIGSDTPSWRTALCTFVGIGFALACSVIAVLCASYLFLTFVKE